jgi:hypothetical protein
MLLVLCSLLGMTPGFGQDVVLKKLYDGIEDMRLEVKSRAAEMISRAPHQNPVLENILINVLRFDQGMLIVTVTG